MYHQSLVDLLSVAALTRLQPAKQRYLFLLSHMRSYSSLLSHVLGTCPEIDGYGETHIKYRNKLDLWRLRQRVHHSMGTELHAPWLLDKILRVLSQWLELSCPLRTEYQVLPRSGEVGFGDPSRNILAGRILDATSSTIADDVRIPDPVLREAEAAYRRCRASLTRTCHTTSEGMWH